VPNKTCMRGERFQLSGMVFDCEANGGRFRHYGRNDKATAPKAEWWSQWEILKQVQNDRGAFRWEAPSWPETFFLDRYYLVSVRKCLFMQGPGA
ncbi:MAG: hypothetical protein ACE5OR_09785, partial [bacterium]